MSVKRRLFQGALLPALTYACETWCLTGRLENKLAVAQRKWERKMLGVTLLDRRTNVWVRNKTGLMDVVEHCRERRFCWVERIAGLDHERWARAVLEWHPRGPIRRKGRPVRRWRDDFVKAVGTEFLRMAAEKKEEWSRAKTLQTQ